MANCFEYGEKETGYLKSRDARLAGVIDKIGLIERETDPDLFSWLASDNKFLRKRRLRYGRE